MLLVLFPSSSNKQHKFQSKTDIQHGMKMDPLKVRTPLREFCFKAAFRSARVAVKIIPSITCTRVDNSECDWVKQFRVSSVENHL